MGSKIRTTSILLDDLRKIHKEITNDRQTLNTKQAKSIITLYKPQKEKHTGYRKIYRSIQKVIGLKDSVVEKLFPEDDEVHLDGKVNLVLTLTPSITGFDSAMVGGSSVFPITPDSM